MELKPGYKQTEIGAIPKDWKVIPLAELASIGHGYGFQGQFFSSHGVFRLATPGHFYESGGFRDVGDKQKFYSGTFPEGYILNKGDLIVAMTEQADGLLGSAALVPLDRIYLHNQRLGKVKPLSPNVSIKYLYWVFNSKRYRAKVRETAAGTKVKHTSPSKLLEILIAAPSTFAEQEAIAEALGDVDALIAALEQLIAKKRHIKQATMQELLTGRTRLPGFTGQWETKLWGDVIVHCSSGATPYRGRPDFYKGKIKWITSGELNYNFITDTIEHISEEAVEKTNLRIHPVGTFLMAITGLEAAGTRGACGIVGSPSATNQSCMAIYPTSELLTEYLYHYYVYKGNELALRYCQGTKQQSYTAQLVRILPIDLPPITTEQAAIATILSDMDTEITTLETKLHKTRLLKQGMMQQLLTGRIRLLDKVQK